MFKKSFALTLVLGILVALFALPAAAQDDVVLELWFNGDELINQFNEEVIAMFEEANPGVDIVYQPYPNEAYKTTLAVAIGSDDPPDMFFNWAGDDTGRFVREGHVLDLSSYAEEFGWAENVSPAALDAFTIDGGLYAAPYSLEAKYFYYNLAIFEEQGLEVPATFADLLNICTTLREAGITPMAFGNQERWEGVHYLSMLNQKVVGEEVIAQDYALATEADTLFADENYAGAFQALLDMQEAGCFADAVNSTTPDAALAQFFTEQTAMYYQGTWIIGPLREAEFEGMYGMFRMPAIEDGAGNQDYVLMGPIGIEVSSKTEHADIAAQFVDFYISADVQSKFVADLDRIPVRADAVDPDAVSASLAFVVNDLATATGATSWLDVVLENTVSEVYLNSIQEVLAGSLTPEEAAAAVREQAVSVQADME